MSLAKLQERPALTVVPSASPKISRVLVSRLEPGQLLVIQNGTAIEAVRGKWYAEVTGVLRVQYISPAQTGRGYHVHLADAEGNHAGWISVNYQKYLDVCEDECDRANADV